MVELLDLTIIAYLLAAIGLLTVPILRAQNKLLKILYGFRFQLTNQCIGVLILWSVGEIVESVFVGEMGEAVRRPIHAIAMLGFAVYITYAFGGLLKRTENTKLQRHAVEKVD